MRSQQEDLDLLAADVDRAIERAEQLNLDLMVYMLRMARLELLDKVREQRISESVDNPRLILLQ